MTGDVLDERILEALEKTGRSDFVPDALKGVAYIDEGLEIARGRFLMQPLVFARMLKYAAIRKNETVLVVGCLTGYSAAVLSHLAQKVVALEEDRELAARAKTLLAAFSNVHFVEAPLVEGALSHSPYDAVIIEGAIEELPQKLTDQLREGGRILAIEHVSQAKLVTSGLGKLMEYKKIDGALFKTILHDASSALLQSFRRKPAFVF